jgi:hypothetical protein
MTGKSDMSKGCMKYYKKLIGALLIIGGGALMLEHLFNFGGFDIEILGHEFYGIVMIVIGYLLCMKWEQVKEVVTAWKDRDLHKLLDDGERE